MPKPVLFLDVDGVISLFGFDPAPANAPGPFHWVDGVVHCIPTDAGKRLVRLADHFELVWATGWEDRANEHLPHILELPFGDLPCLTFGGRAVFGSSHWKLDALGRFAAGRPAAWIDDNIDSQCRDWATERESPTFLVRTQSHVGMTDEHVERLLEWAGRMTPEPDEITPANRSSEAA